MIAVAAGLGYLIGSVPSAAWIARLSGIDLRQDGSQNPGANNARALGGVRLGATVLLVEIVKGVAAVAGGATLAGSGGATAAGIGALAGNVYNVWYHFAGGQGLGITAGILLGAWPTWLPVVLVVIAGVTALTRSTAKAALCALTAIALGAVAQSAVDLPAAWGVDDPLVRVLAAGLIVFIAPKQIRKLRVSDHPTAIGLDDESHRPVVD